MANRADSRPLVSVVVPTYGRPAMLERAVTSVAAQTYVPVQLVVVDDHSPDPAESVLDRLDLEGIDDVTLVRHEENRGANAARNTGIRAADGEYVAFLDDDDEWFPTYLERVVERFEAADPAVGLVTTGAVVVDSDGSVRATMTPAADGDGLEALLDGEMVGSFSRFVVRSTVVDDVGLPDERLPNWQDWEWQFRIGRSYEFASVSDPLVRRHLGNHDQLTDDFQGRRDVSYPLIRDRYEEAMRARSERAYSRFRALLLRSLAASAIRNSHYLLGIKYLCYSVRYDPTNAEGYQYLLAVLGGPFTYHAWRRFRRRLSAWSSDFDSDPDATSGTHD